MPNLDRNNRSSLVYLDTQYEPVCERVRDWEGYIGAYIAFNGRLEANMIHQLLGGARTPTSRMGNRTAVNADFVLHLTKCTGMPDWLGDVEPMGRYLPAVLIISAGIRPLVSEPNDCPHCAYLRATELLSRGVGVNSEHHRPTVYYVGPTAEISEVEFDIEMDAEGRITFESSTTKIEFTERGCANCGFPGHTKAACAVTRNYAKIGVEIEGRFLNIDELSEAAENDGLDVTSDGSIRYGTNLGCEPREIRTKPDLLAGCLRQVAKYYPDEADKSCGMHVHVSFADTASVSTLTCPEFYAYFKNRWTTWGQRMQLSPSSQFFQRLNGNNDYCLANDDCDFEFPFRGDRYRQLNFTSWERHNTVECRLLPMFREARLALSAITELISIYEDWLNRDCAVHLPAVSADVSVSLQEAKWCAAGVVDTDFADTSAKMVGQVELVDLPPVPEGHRRIFLSELNPSARAIFINVLESAA